jgi:hypothetical protein
MSRLATARGERGGKTATYGNKNPATEYFEGINMSMWI